MTKMWVFRQNVQKDQDVAFRQNVQNDQNVGFRQNVQNDQNVGFGQNVQNEMYKNMLYDQNVMLNKMYFCHDPNL